MLGSDASKLYCATDAAALSSVLDVVSGDDAVVVESVVDEFVSFVVDVLVSGRLNTGMTIGTSSCRNSASS